MYKSTSQNKPNQRVGPSLVLFVLTVISINRRKEIIRRFRGSKKKLNIFEKIKNKLLALCKKLVGDFFKGLKGFKNLMTVARQNLC